MDDRCVYCGEIIPEGRMACPECEKMYKTEMVLIDKEEKMTDKEFRERIFDLLTMDKSYFCIADSQEVANSVAYTWLLNRVLEHARVWNKYFRI